MEDEEHFVCRCRAQCCITTHWDVFATQRCNVAMFATRCDAMQLFLPQMRQIR
ncbi:hypothetical protein KP509_32G070500 [Ceratopteris richardii]|nr:hypothetical protein KP509_32G070500 [Ceratopteris richardii]